MLGKIMRTLYFDCFAGISGNMVLGALLDAGVDRRHLLSQLERLSVPFGLQDEKVDRSGISCTHVKVAAPDESGHRHLSTIRGIIEGSGLSAAIVSRSLAIFEKLAEAEAEVHGVTPDKVHFHEVGAVDAIVDIVGACIGFEMLGIERFVSSPVRLGKGFIEMDHGTFPVPPPAVASLLKGVPVFSGSLEGEFTTPTGAAIIATVCDSYTSLPEMVVEALGYGAGTRVYDRFPNALRVFVGEAAEAEVSPEQLFVVECNIDDASPQDLGFVTEKALGAGALDCWLTPVQMKKGRPGNVVSILCRPAARAAMTELLFAETPTLGVRCQSVHRTALERETHDVDTEFGTIRVKVGLRNGSRTAMPEFDDVRSAALKYGKPLRIVRDAAMSAYQAASGGTTENNDGRKKG
jgi:pyridinium-3,5-bisthiocarboxylic acid mononucleotide nickel chelatase